MAKTVQTLTASQVFIWQPDTEESGKLTIINDNLLSVSSTGTVKVETFKAGNFFEREAALTNDENIYPIADVEKVRITDSGGGSDIVLSTRK